jgi:hypothetical protein
VADADGAVPAVAADVPGVRMALDVPFETDGTRSMLRLCDYASAGRTWSEESVLRVWLPQPLNLSAPFEGIAPAKPKE